MINLVMVIDEHEDAAKNVFSGMAGLVLIFFRYHLFRVVLNDSSRGRFKK